MLLGRTPYTKIHHEVFGVFSDVFRIVWITQVNDCYIGTSNSVPELLRSLVGISRRSMSEIATRHGMLGLTALPYVLFVTTV